MAKFKRRLCSERKLKDVEVAAIREIRASEMLEFLNNTQIFDILHNDWKCSFHLAKNISGVSWHAF